MSKYVRNLYTRVDNEVKASPKKVEPTKGLVGRRGKSSGDDVNPVVDYVKYIRELREGNHAVK